GFPEQLERRQGQGGCGCLDRSLAIRREPRRMQRRERRPGLLRCLVLRRLRRADPQEHGGSTRRLPELAEILRDHLRASFEDVLRADLLRDGPCVWMARTVRAAITIGSTVVFGFAPCPPRPKIVMSTESTLAIP